MEIYIILFKDGSMMFSGMPPEKSHYQDDAKFFKTSDEIYLYNLTNWVVNNFKENNLIKELNL